MRRFSNRMFTCGLVVWLSAWNGLAHYVDRLGHASDYFRDLANRSLTVTNALLQTTVAGFNPAGDLISLSDGKNQTTTWKRDVFGLVRTNVNAASAEVLRLDYNANWQLTNRWTPAKSNTVYKVNALGSVTNIVYPAGTSNVVIRYD